MTVVLTLMFLISIGGMVISGHASHNNELESHGEAAIALFPYLASGSFLSALFENWESEFLQMSAYVVLTAMLLQRGSSESRDPDTGTRPDDELTSEVVRRRPVLSWLYSYSLGLTLGALFLASFALHWVASLRASNADAILHGTTPLTMLDHLAGSELRVIPELAVGVSLNGRTCRSFYLSPAQRLPESKPVAAPNEKTGSE